MPWKWLNFFLQDDAELARIGREYGSGRMLTGEIKAELVRDSWTLRCAALRWAAPVAAACCSPWFTRQGARAPRFVPTAARVATTLRPWPRTPLSWLAPLSLGCRCACWWT